MTVDLAAVRPTGAQTLPRTMRAAVLTGPRRLEVIDKPVPTAGPQDVLVKVAMCGTCGTDVMLQEKPLPGQPPYGMFTPGHEWTGTVVALGETVDEVRVGDRVAIHVHHGCGRCRNCSVGAYTSCDNYGNPTKSHATSGMTVDGGFAEYAVHHVSNVHPLPQGLSWEDAVLITTAGTALYGLDRLGGLVAGDRVAIVGPGPVGLMAVQAVRALGAGEIILLGTRETRLRAGRNLGADHVVNVTEVDPVEAVRDITGGRGADLVIEASGNAGMPQRSLHMVRRGGAILFLAFYKEPVTFDLSLANLSELRLVTSRGEGRDAVHRAVGLASRGLIRGHDMVTHRYPLEDIQRGFDEIRNRVHDPVKVVFIP
jgi:L-iditol 2-dehydrogenase